MTSAPSKERRQHVEDIDAPQIDGSSFRQGWRVRTRLDALLLDGWINAAQWQAGCEYRDCYLRLNSGQASFLAERTSGGADAHDRMVGKAAIERRLREANGYLGHLSAALLFKLLVLDQSWRELGRWLRCDRETARRVAALALHALGALWALKSPPGGLHAVQGASERPHGRPIA